MGKLISRRAARLRQLYHRRFVPPERVERRASAGSFGELFVAGLMIALEEAPDELLQDYDPLGVDELHAGRAESLDSVLSPPPIPPAVAA